jgi:hypothetical protein
MRYLPNQYLPLFHLVISFTTAINGSEWMSFSNSDTECLRGNIMDIETLTRFFMWCTIINGALLVFWIIMLISAPEMIYRTQQIWFPIPRETFNIVMYCFLGFFKIIFLVFNLVPWLALLIVG